METMRDIHLRQKSINSTKQITESMRLVSTRKVQKIKLHMEENRPYLTQSIRSISSVAYEPEIARHSYIAGHRTGKPLVIIITGDRGLCGGYNINVQKEAFELIKKLGDVHIITIGEKGREYCLRRRRQADHAFRGLSENPFYEDAQHIGGIALRMYNDKVVDQIYLAYTEYHSMLLQTPKVVRLLPFDAAQFNDAEKTNLIMRYEPNVETFLNRAISRYIDAMLFGAMLEGAVSEQSSRITSMDSAVKNSDKIIDSLTLQYNQMRQGAITQEIAEIVGGANAV